MEKLCKPLKGSINERKKRPSPNTSRIVIFIITFILFFIVITITLVPIVSGESPAHHFYEENSNITALFATLLSIGSGFGWIIFLTSSRKSLNQRLFWLVISTVLFFFALDEQLGFHELIGDRLDEVAFFGRIVDQMAIRGWNDIIIILYGLAAIPVGFFFIPTVLIYPKVLEYLCIAFCFYIPHTIMDAIIEPPTDLSRIIEESVKLFSSTFQMIAMLIGLLEIIHSSKMEK